MDLYLADVSRVLNAPAAPVFLPILYTQTFFIRPITKYRTKKSNNLIIE